MCVDSVNCGGQCPECKPRRRRYRLTLRGRTTTLYRVWKNIRNRVRGKSTTTPHLYDGIELGFSTFAEFRAYALTHGFRAWSTSPDRRDPTKGYVPGNLRFIPKKFNFSRRRNLSEIPASD